MEVAFEVTIARIGAAMLMPMFFACASPPDENPLTSSTPIDYARQIRPILEANCYECHGPGGVPSGRLRLDERSMALAGGRSGRPAIIPGNGAESPLVVAISGGDDETWRAMPPRGRGLRPEQVRLIRYWIDQGAAFEVE